MSRSQLHPPGWCTRSSGMSGKDRPDLRLIDGRQDAVVRRRTFEEAHPETVILPPSADRWRAVLPAGLIPGDGTKTTIGTWDLADLMDRLDAIYSNTSEDTAG
jgi:hypothetical protein